MRMEHHVLRLACERSRKTQPQTSRGHAFSRAQRPSIIAAKATASTCPSAPSSLPRRVLFDRSGAYFMLHHGGEDYIAMADGMSPDLKPLVTRLNAILTGNGRGERRTVHRWGRI